MISHSFLLIECFGERTSIWLSGLQTRGQSEKGRMRGRMEKEEVEGVGGKAGRS